MSGVHPCARSCWLMFTPRCSIWVGWGVGWCGVCVWGGGGGVGGWVGGWGGGGGGGRHVRSCLSSCRRRGRGAIRGEPLTQHQQPTSCKGKVHTNACLASASTPNRKPPTHPPTHPPGSEPPAAARGLRQCAAAPPPRGPARASTSLHRLPRFLERAAGRRTEWRRSTATRRRSVEGMGDREVGAGEQWREGRCARGGMGWPHRDFGLQWNRFMRPSRTAVQCSRRGGFATAVGGRLAAARSGLRRCPVPVGAARDACDEQTSSDGSPISRTSKKV